MILCGIVSRLQGLRCSGLSHLVYWLFWHLDFLRKEMMNRTGPFSKTTTTTKKRNKTKQSHGEWDGEHENDFTFIRCLIAFAVECAYLCVLFLQTVKWLTVQLPWENIHICVANLFVNLVTYRAIFVKCGSSHIFISQLSKISKSFCFLYLVDGILLNCLSSSNHL